MIFEFAHQMALLPILALVYILAKGKLPQLDQVLLTASFFISWIADSLTTYFARGEVEYGQIWIPIQFVLAIFASRRGKLNIPIFIYFGIGTVALILFRSLDAGPNVMAFWLFYQACRLTALLVLSFLILAPPKGKVIHHVVPN